MLGRSTGTVCLGSGGAAGIVVVDLRACVLDAGIKQARVSGLIVRVALHNLAGSPPFPSPHYHYTSIAYNVALNVYGV